VKREARCKTGAAPATVTGDVLRDRHSRPVSDGGGEGAEDGRSGSQETGLNVTTSPSFGEEGQARFPSFWRYARGPPPPGREVLLPLLPAITVLSVAWGADEAIVVAAPHGPDPGSTAASLTVLPLGADLPPGEDLAAVIDTASGTTVRRLGGLGDFAAVSLRGSTFRQVEVYLDGLPLNPDGAAAVNLSELPVTTFSRVELYRGMAPVAFGSGAIGGVLNLVTPGGAAPPSATIRLGSFGTVGTSAIVTPAVATGGPGHVEALLALDQLHTEGDFPYFDDQGTEYNLFDDRTSVRVNNALDRASVLGRLRFGAPAARITVLDSFVGSHQELPGPISAGATQASFGVTRNLLSASADLLPTAGLRVLPQAWWLFREETFDDRAAEIGTGTQYSRDRAATFGAQASAVWAPVAWVTGTLVVRARHERYTPYDLVLDVGDGDRQRAGGLAALGADVRLWSDRLTLSPAAQVEVLDDRAIGTTPWEGTPVADTRLSAWPTPRMGALLRPLPWLALKGNAGLYLRAPDLTELFGDHGLVIGNEDLVPEHGTSWEVGLRAEAPWEGLVQGSVDVAYARRRVTDLIVYVQNSQFTQIAQNVGDAYVRSTEAALAISLGPWVSSRTNVTWTLTRNLVDEPAYADKALPGIPPVEVNQETTLRLPGRIGLSHTWSYTGLTYTDTADIGFTAPRNLHSFALDLTPVVGLPTLRAELLNAFDVRGTAVDRNPLDEADDTSIVRPLTDFSGYPLPGRTVMVAVSWTDSPRR
jgi:iron complex outermembrane receptor protein